VEEGVIILYSDKYNIHLSHYLSWVSKTNT